VPVAYLVFRGAAALEEDAVLDEQGRMSWVLKRQTEYDLVK
jgi:hypothetical protein